MTVGVVKLLVGTWVDNLVDDNLVFLAGMEHITILLRTLKFLYFLRSHNIQTHQDECLSVLKLYLDCKSLIFRIVLIKLLVVKLL